MPILKSAKKALRQNTKRREINSKKRAALKSVIKKYRKMVVAGKKDEAKTYLPTVYKNLDKSTKVNLIKKNTASRLKSRLTKLINAK